MSKRRTIAFASNAEHLLAEMAWLDLLIRREVLDERKRHERDPGDPFKALYISDQEVASLVNPAESGRSGERKQPWPAEYAALRLDIERRRDASIAVGVHLALPHAARVFALTEFEQDVLLLALASDIDVKYERLFGWLQDDISRKQPSVGLALRMLCQTAGERLHARTAFAADASLARARLLRPIATADGPLLSRPLILDNAVVEFLMAPRMDAGALPPGARSYKSSRSLDALRWSGQMRNGISQVTRTHMSGASGPGRRLIFALQGQAGSGRKTLASCLCEKVDARLMVIDVQALAAGGEGFEDALRGAFRHGLLRRSAIYLERTGPLLAEDDKGAAARDALRRAIDDLGWLVFVATDDPWPAGDLFRDHVFLAIDLPVPDVAEREVLWTEFAAEAKAVFAPGVPWAEIASKFRLTPGQIKGAIQTAINRSRLHGADVPVTSEELHKGCHAQSSRKLAALARRLDAQYTWADISLPATALAQMHEVCAQIRHRRTVYRDWGFEGTLSLGKGLAVLFYGQSGVGKTMSVEVLASELGLEVYKIDLSGVVSKYIGETEKNLSRIFHEAESSNAILFFDEADALCGRRTEVKDAHDRYANIEVNYLLQRMEEFEGLVILATNLRKNIDEGFMRRMHFAVEFPFPDAVYRYRIWRKHLPAVAPLKDDIDFNYLAERFNLSGGNIRNIVLNAAFLAAEGGSLIGMEHMIRATRREYEKIGRICTEMDFRPYQGWLTEKSA